MCGAFLDDELGLDARGLELLEDQLGLLDRHELVGVAVDDQRGRIVGRDVIDRADLAADFQDPGLVGDRPEDLGLRVLLLEIERRLETRQDAAAHGVFARLAVVEEIGRREEAADGLDAARGLVDRDPWRSCPPGRRPFPA